MPLPELGRVVVHVENVDHNLDLGRELRAAVVRRSYHQIVAVPFLAIKTSPTKIELALKLFFFDLVS